MKITPYLHFNGQCRAAFEFYAETIGATIGLIMTYGQAPVDTHCSDAFKDKIMHMVLHTRDGVVMGADLPDERFAGNKGFALSLNPADPAEAERLYAAFAAGGAVQMALQETFWATKFGMVTDRFGIPWMISCDKPQ